MNLMEDPLLKVLILISIMISHDWFFGFILFRLVCSATLQLAE